MSLREQYNKNGYVIKNLLNCTIPFCNEENLNNIFSKGEDTYISFLKTSAKLVMVQRMFLNFNVAIMLKELNIKLPIISDQPVVNVMSPKLKITNGYHGTKSHQDWPSVQGSLDMVTVWIALTDIKKNNFPLEVIPGSHLGGLRDGKVNGSVLEVETDDKDFIPIECKAGDVIFMSGFLVHRTGKGNGFRVAVSQRFDNAAEPTFIERSYPCAQKRVVDREIKWKPTVEQIRKIYAVD